MGQLKCLPVVAQQEPEWGQERLSPWSQSCSAQGQLNSLLAAAQPGPERGQESSSLWSQPCSAQGQLKGSPMAAQLGPERGQEGGVAVVPVMLGSGTTEGFPNGSAAGAKIGARASGVGMGAWSSPFLLTSFESISPTPVAPVTTIGGATKPPVLELAGGIVSAP